MGEKEIPVNTSIYTTLNLLLALAYECVDVIIDEL